MDGRNKITTVFYIILYLLAIVTANLVTAKFGKSASVINSFLFIGLDLTSRDKLHEAWKQRGLFWKMGLLISFGSLLSWFMNRNAGIIALASFTAFVVSAIVDAFTYQILHKKSYFVKVNGSNVFSALFDSILFPVIAFGGIMPALTLFQFIAKITGGFIWSYILGRKQ